jgi:hypothetical protein
VNEFEDQNRFFSTDEDISAQEISLITFDLSFENFTLVRFYFSNLMTFSIIEALSLLDITAN